MKTQTKRLTYLLLGIAALVVAGALCWQRLAPRQPTELAVALYPYVPDTARFEEAVSAEWEAAHPDIELTFVSWDCYSEDPPEDVDVFVFDSIFLAHLVGQGYLLPIPDERIGDREDILPFALEACTVDDEVYALPEFLCSELHYTRKGDAELDGVSSVAELHDVLGDHTYEEASTGSDGLLMDLTGNTTKTLAYLQAVMDSEQRFETELPALTGDSLSEGGEERCAPLSPWGPRGTARASATSSPTTTPSSSQPAPGGPTSATRRPCRSWATMWTRST